MYILYMIRLYGKNNAQIITQNKMFLIFIFLTLYSQIISLYYHNPLLTIMILLSLNINVVSIIRLNHKPYVIKILKLYHITIFRKNHISTRAVTQFYKSFIYLDIGFLTA